MTVEKRFVKYDGNKIIDLKDDNSWRISIGNVDLLLELLNKKTTDKRHCRNCKYLGLDGMFGLICDARGNNKNYDCPKYEEKDD